MTIAIHCKHTTDYRLGLVHVEMHEELWPTVTPIEAIDHRLQLYWHRYASALPPSATTVS